MLINNINYRQSSHLNNDIVTLYDVTANKNGRRFPGTDQILKTDHFVDVSSCVCNRLDKGI